MEALDSGQNEDKRDINRHYLGSCFVLGWRDNEDELVNIDSSDESKDDIESGSNAAIFSAKMPGILSVEMVPLSGSQEVAICGMPMQEASLVADPPEKQSIGNRNVFASLDCDKRTAICSSESSPASQELLSRESLQGVDNTGKRTFDGQVSDLKQVGGNGRSISAKRLKAAAQLVPYKMGVVKLDNVSERLDSRRFRKAFKDKLLGLKSLKHLPNLAQSKQENSSKAFSEKDKEEEQSATAVEHAQTFSDKLDNRHGKGLDLNNSLKEKSRTYSKTRKDVQAFRKQSGFVDSAVNARAEDISISDNDSYDIETRNLAQELTEEIYQCNNVKTCADGQLGTQFLRKKSKVHESGKNSTSLVGDQDQEQTRDLEVSEDKQCKLNVLTKNIFSAKAIGRPFSKVNAAVVKKAPEQSSIEKTPFKRLRNSGCNRPMNSAIQRILGKLAVNKRKANEKLCLSTKNSNGIAKNEVVDNFSNKTKLKKFRKSSSEFQRTLCPDEKQQSGDYQYKVHKHSSGMDIQAKKAEVTDVLKLDQVNGVCRASSRSSNRLLIASRSVSKRRKHLHATLNSTLKGKQPQKLSERLVDGNDVTNASRLGSSAKLNADTAFTQERELDGSNSTFDNEKWKSYQWVECITCKKWRRIPFDVEILTKSWQCKDNIWDVNFASCNAPQDAIAEFSPHCESDSVSVSASRSISVNLPNLAEVIVVSNNPLDSKKLVGDGCVLEGMKQMELVWVKIDDADGWWPAKLLQASDLQNNRPLANEKTLHLFQSDKLAGEFSVNKTSCLLPFGEHYNSLKASNNTASFKAAILEAYAMYMKKSQIVEGSSEQVIKEACTGKNLIEEPVNCDTEIFDTGISAAIDLSKGGINSEAIHASAGEDGDKYLSSPLSSDTDQQVIASDIRKGAILDTSMRAAVPNVTAVTNVDTEAATIDGDLCDNIKPSIKQTFEHNNQLLHHPGAAYEKDNHISLNLSSTLDVLENGRFASCFEDEMLIPEGTTVGYSFPKEIFSGTRNKIAHPNSEHTEMHALGQPISSTIGGTLSQPVNDCTQETGSLEVRQGAKAKDLNQKVHIEMKERLKYQHIRTAVGAGEVAPECSQDGDGDHKVSSSYDVHHSFCEVCGEGGELLCCDGKNCRNTYHLGCLDPPLSQVPKGNWYCPGCFPKIHAVFGEVESIWDGQKHIYPTQVMASKSCTDGGSLGNMYYVKWKERAHIHNCWVSERELVKLAPKKLKIFKLKVQQGQALKWDPEWAIPHRLIGKRLHVDEPRTGNGSASVCRCEWFVKWKNLGYDKCSWELAEPPLYSIRDVADLEKSYELRCAAASSRAEHQSMQEAKKLRDSVFVKLNHQPEWVVGGQLLPRQLDVLNELRKFWTNYTSCIVIDGASQERIITTINFLVSLIKEFRVVRPLLVVGSSDSVPIWEAEIAHWAAGINAVIYNGSREAREVIQEFEIGTAVENVKVQLLVTTFEIFNADVNYLREFKWEALLIDEGQRIRAAKTFQNLKSVAAEFCLFCSSEELKINVDDLFHVYSLVEQDKALVDAESQSIFTRENEDAKVEDLQNKVNPHIVCHHQCETPQNIHLEYWVPVSMPQIQVHEYCRILVQNYELLQTSRMRSDHVARLKDLLLRLRDCCNHPYLVSPSLQASLANVLPGRALLDAGIKASGKLQLLDSMLSQLKQESRRVLLLTQATSRRGISQIDILEDLLRLQFGVDAYERVDSKFSWQKKQAALQRFNARDSGRFIFLIDRHSCGLSIKLSAIDTIIIYDSNWNPHTDVQALFRAHITSSCKKILVYRLYSQHTLEERVLLEAHQTGTSDSQKTLTSKYCQQAVKWGAETLLKLDEHHVIADNSTSGWELQFLKQKFPFVINNTLESAEHEVCLDAETVKLILGGDPAQLHSSSSVNKFLQKVLLPREMRPDGNENPSLFSVTQVCSEGESDSGEVFWNRLLRQKFEQWQARDGKGDFRKGQRPRKKVQYNESVEGSADISSVTPFVSSQERCKRRKISGEPGKAASAVSEKVANENAGGNWAECERTGITASVEMPAHTLTRAVSSGPEAQYVGLGLLKAASACLNERNKSTPLIADSEVVRTPIDTDLLSKSTDFCASPTIDDESVQDVLHKDPSQEIESSKVYLQSDQDEKSNGEKCSECAKTVRSVQKELHMAMKPELAKLCQILDISKDVAEHAGELLGFIVHKFRMHTERSLVHAVELSLCWIAAERLGLDINFTRTLSLAKERLNFKMKDQQLKLTHEKLKEQCMRYKPTSLTGKQSNEQGADPLIESYVSHSGLQEPNSVSLLQTPREVLMQLHPGHNTGDLGSVPSPSENHDAVSPPLHELTPQQPHRGPSTLKNNMRRPLEQLCDPQTNGHNLVEPLEVHREQSDADTRDGQSLNADSLPCTQQKTPVQQLDLANGSQLQPEQVPMKMLASLKDQLLAKKVERMRSLLNLQKVEFHNFEVHAKRERASLRRQQGIDHAKVVGTKLSEIDMRSMLVHQVKLHAFQEKRLEERLQKERRELVSKQATDRDKQNKFFAMQIEHLNAGRTSLVAADFLKRTCFADATVVSSVSQAVVPQLSKSIEPLIPREEQPPESGMPQADLSTEEETLHCIQQNLEPCQQISVAPNQQEQSVQCSLSQQCDTNANPIFDILSCSVSFQIVPLPPSCPRGDVSSSLVQHESQGRPQRTSEHAQHKLSLQHIPQTTLHIDHSIGEAASSQQCFVDGQQHDLCHQRDVQNPSPRLPQTSSTAQHQRATQSLLHLTPSFPLLSHHINQCLATSVPGQTAIVTVGHATLVRDEPHVTISTSPFHASVLPYSRPTQLRLPDPLRHEEIKLRKEQEMLKQTFHEESTKIRREYEREAAALKRKYELLLFEEHRSFSNKNENLQKNIRKVELNRRVADALRMKGLFLYSAHSTPGFGVDAAARGHPLSPAVGSFPLGTHRSLLHQYSMPLSAPVLAHRIPGNQVIHVPNLNTTSRVLVSENLASVGIAPFILPSAERAAEVVTALQPRYCNTPLPTPRSTLEPLPVVANMSTSSLQADSAFAATQSSFPEMIGDPCQSVALTASHGDGSYSPTIQQLAYLAADQAFTADIRCPPSVNIEDEVSCMLPLDQTIISQSTVSVIQNNSLLSTLFMPRNLSDVVCSSSVPNTMETCGITNPQVVGVGDLRGVVGSGKALNQVQSLIPSQKICESGLDVHLEQHRVVYVSDDD